MRAMRGSLKQNQLLRRLLRTLLRNCYVQGGQSVPLSTSGTAAAAWIGRAVGKLHYNSFRALSLNAFRLPPALLPSPCHSRLAFFFARNSIMPSVANFCPLSRTESDMTYATVLMEMRSPAGAVTPLSATASKDGFQ